MDIRNIILFIVSVLDIIVALVIFIHNPKKVMNIAYSLTAVWAGLWGFGIAMFRMSTIHLEQLVWNQFFIFVAALVGSGFLHFSLVFGDKAAKLDLRRFILVYAPNLIVLWAVLTPGVMIKDIVVRSWGNESILGWGYIYYGLYFALLWLWATFNLFKKYAKGEPSLRQQILFIYIGIGVSIVFGATFNLIFILLGNYQYIWLGPYAMFCFVIATSYAVAKHQLLDIKVVTTEIFAIFLSLLTFSDLFRTSGGWEFSGKLALFLLTLFFSILLIRSVLNEVRRREEMEKLTEELKKTTKKLASANKELERLDEAKSEFLSIASHQLRTPSTIIKGYISMMLEGSFGKVPKIIKENLDKVYISNERLLNLIETLLNISRIESGRLEFNTQPVDLVKTIEPIVADFQKKAKEKGLKLEFRAEKDIPQAKADPQKVKEVISNLIDNSVKYTKEGEVIIGLHQEGQSVVFTCQDTGIGIDPEDVPRLFNKFVRGKGMMQVYTEGTGLGLYFARMVIENMGGRIWAESPGKGKGSKFSFSLTMADKNKAKKVS
ncbi:MAG: ATP-binding protein [Patescibacteria group bacterium]